MIGREPWYPEGSLEGVLLCPALTQSLVTEPTADSEGPTIAPSPRIHRPGVAAPFLTLAILGSPRGQQHPHQCRLYARLRSLCLLGPSHRPSRLKKGPGQHPAAKALSLGVMPGCEACLSSSRESRADVLQQFAHQAGAAWRITRPERTQSEWKHLDPRKDARHLVVTMGVEEGRDQRQREAGCSKSSKPAATSHLPIHPLHTGRP